MKKRILALCLCLCLPLVGCMRETGDQGEVQGAGRGEKPPLPEGLEAGEDGVPELTVHVTSAGENQRMDIETYLCGVVAGEMKNDWPEEALKAQAILARTYTLKFVEDKTSRYADADISTDVREAQAYAAQDVNERVRSAVAATRGQVMVADGEFPYAWFHAHAGGMTEVPSVALNYQGEDPDYLSPTASPDSDKAPDSAKQWTAVFTQAQVGQACADAGVSTGDAASVEIGDVGASGRAETFLVNGQKVRAAEMRINLGADKLRSTLIDGISVEDGSVTFSGRGFGHGVGMSQWGAYGMAEAGKSAEEIVEYYFQGIDIVKMW